MLEGPFEFFDSARMRSIKFVPTGTDGGIATITDRDSGQPKTVMVLRVHVTPLSKPTAPFYYDFTSKTLMPVLEALLPGAIRVAATIEIEAVGTGKATRFTIRRL